MVAVHPSPIAPLSFTARTRDGLEARLVVSVLWCVADPTLAVHAATEARAATADEVERGCTSWSPT